ncbi:MAG: DUF1684 domain-containing protein [Bacteroidetes bacterium]|nr:DUF1684 domain-containing protein [Bacteroidota bacterium]
MYSFLNILLIYFLAFFMTLPGSSWSTEYIKEVETHRKLLNKEYRKKETSPFKNDFDRRRFRRLNYFQVDTNYRVQAIFVKTEGGKILSFPTSAKKIKKYRDYGKLHFEIHGSKQVLHVYQSMKLMEKEEYKDQLFLLFTDLTNGNETYGGGRYIDMEGPLSDTTMLDFNYVYNPYCAYSDGWNCPIPPKINALNIRIEAGEKMYGLH